jgi:hypothetical protein
MNQNVEDLENMSIVELKVPNRLLTHTYSAPTWMLVQQKIQFIYLSKHSVFGILQALVIVIEGGNPWNFVCCI